MNSVGVVNEDRISELPEALILQILSLLPTKLSIATSVLSKQWQSRWKMLPKLKFDCCRGLELGNVFRTLLSHNAPVLQSFHLNVRLGTCNSVLDTGIITGLALARNVRELVLEVESDTFFTFPRCLYNCETLETLKLKTRAAITDVPSTVCMKSLRTLHLDGVDFNDDDSVLNLLSGCPNLENLEVHRDLGTSVKTYIIAVPSLQRLSIYNNYRGNQHYVISAPSLKYLKILWFNAPESCLIQNVPELVEASLTNLDNIIDENLLGSLTSVKRLSLALSPVKVKFPTRSIIFNHLVYLELFTTKVTWWNLLTLMLDSSPKLQVLKLNNIC
ncbi:PREDICTED: putative FBD-associated F-box protein At1g55030 [Camelina sativa]|uniref:FBD-associated F-box protein At1g55030 n=1 Tax=Camelina sativa TaxID=90675 RepID=A0ABM0YWR9_CAMSA|nr:PREDICTED: putative FBD-associated F-box protein At1g55030 [Camelina sativa]